MRWGCSYKYIGRLSAFCVPGCAPHPFCNADFQLQHSAYKITWVYHCIFIPRNASFPAVLRPHEEDTAGDTQDCIIQGRVLLQNFLRSSRVRSFALE